MADLLLVSNSFAFSARLSPSFLSPSTLVLSLPLFSSQHVNGCAGASIMCSHPSVSIRLAPPLRLSLFVSAPGGGVRSTVILGQDLGWTQ